MIIRSATLKDGVALQQLVAELGYEITVEEMLFNLDRYQQTDAHLFVAEEEGIAGFIAGAYLPLFHIKENMLRITALCVSAASRHKGIGKALVQKMETVCMDNNCYYLELTSGAHRSEAHRFYERMGYKVYEGKRFTKRLLPKALP